MIHPQTVQKALDYILLLKDLFEEEQSISITKLAEAKKQPSEYNKWLIEEGFLIKTSRGKAGIGSYIWNKKKTPTEADAEMFCSRYNELRSEEARSRTVKHRQPQIADEMLTEIVGILRGINELLMKMNDHPNRPTVLDISNAFKHLQGNDSETQNTNS